MGQRFRIELFAPADAVGLPQGAPESHRLIEHAGRSYRPCPGTYVTERYVPTPVAWHLLMADADRTAPFTQIADADAAANRYLDTVTAFQNAIDPTPSPFDSTSIAMRISRRSLAWNGLRRLLTTFDFARHVQVLTFLAMPRPMGCMIRFGFADECSNEASADAFVDYSRWIARAVRAVTAGDTTVLTALAGIQHHVAGIEPAVGVVLRDNWTYDSDAAIIAWSASFEAEGREAFIQYIVANDAGLVSTVPEN